MHRRGGGGQGFQSTMDRALPPCKNTAQIMRPILSRNAAQFCRRSYLGLCLCAVRRRRGEGEEAEPDGSDGKALRRRRGAETAHDHCANKEGKSSDERRQSEQPRRL